MKSKRFAEALENLSAARQSNGEMHSPFIALFPVDGAAISTMGDLLGTETVSASSDQAARIDELQFDLGEGPCWDALALARTVSEPNMRRSPSGRWPAFREAIASEDVGALFALPMVIGPLRIGAIDLYSTDPTVLDDESIRQGEAMANVVGRHILKSSLAEVGRDYRDELRNPLSRRVLHQATGMVLAQLGLSAADARLVIEGHAFAAGITVVEVAQRIVDRDLVLPGLPSTVEPDE